MVSFFFETEEAKRYSAQPGVECDLCSMSLFSVAQE